MKCNVVKDLLALYADDVCSDETKADIEEHLKTCDECSKELENYKKKIEVNLNKYDDTTKVKPLKKIKKIKQFIWVLLALIIVLGIVLFQMSFKAHHNQYFGYNYVSTYYKTKKQTDYLLNGKIDEFTGNLSCNNMKMKILS